MHRQSRNLLLIPIVAATFFWMFNSVLSTSSTRLGRGALDVINATTTTTTTPTSTLTPTNTTSSPVCGWSVVLGPDTGISSSLAGIAAVSADDIWAVGNYADSWSSPIQTLTLHWDGTTWDVVPSPNIGQHNYLTGVAAVSHDDVWAVGYYYEPGCCRGALILHWDGTAWHAVPSPEAGTSGRLTSVAALSSDNVWAVGYSGYPNRTLILHWDGEKWDAVPSPNAGTESNYLTGVAAVSADDIWAVGVYRSPYYCGDWTLILHWDGTAWNVVSSPYPYPGKDNRLTGVTAVSADDVWAVGYYNSLHTGDRMLILHWDGTAWHVVPGPDTGTGGQLTGIAAVSADDVWAVGYSGRYYQMLILHWDGQSWGVVASPKIDTSSRLTGVAAIPTDDVWAVGYSRQALVMRYTKPPCVTPTPTPSLTATPAGMPTSTVTPTPTATPTSQPGPPILYQPPDGAVLPQPVSPNEWYFSWSVRMGPCSSWISIRGPGGRGLSEEYGYPYNPYSRLRYTTDEYLPDDALGPWCWNVWVRCPLGRNFSETRAFWVEPAPVPVHTPTPIPGTLQLTASDAKAGDNFGRSVAAVGNYLIIGAPAPSNDNSGAAYIFVHTQNTWEQQAKLAVAGGGPDTQFGKSVSISGNYAIVGTNEDDNGIDSGSAYVFGRTGDTWTQRTRLIATDGEATDYFGTSVAISEDYAVIGAPYDDDKGGSSGSVYIFARTGDIWIQQAKLTARDGTEGDRFGTSVAISRNSVIIGAPGDGSGSAYIFVRRGDAWMQQAKLTTGYAVSDFGKSVAIRGDQAIIGASRGRATYVRPPGSAYVFVRDGDIWAREGELTPHDGVEGDPSGESVAINGSLAIVGIRAYEPYRHYYRGLTYAFVRQAGTWIQGGKLVTGDGGAGGQFGSSVAVTENYAIIGAPYDDDRGRDSGSVYVFDISFLMPDLNWKAYLPLLLDLTR